MKKRTRIGCNLARVALAVASLALAGLAFAGNGNSPGNNGGGNGGCGVGQQTNGCGGTTPTSPTAPVYTGGAGGNGGTGLGVGVGVGVASAASTSSAGAAVVGSGNSTNNIRNTNTQGQQQGQQQGQSQSSRNNNQSSATGGAGGQATAAGGASGGNTLSTGVTVEGDKGDVVYAPAQDRAPVATAYAAPLTATNGTCMGSTSGGVQLAGWGASGATTWTDASCDIRYDAEALRAAGLPLAARARLCQKPDIAKAMAAAGTPCVDLGAAERRVEAILNDEPSSVAQRRQPMPWQAGG